MAIVYDMHTHCDFSTDSKTPMKEQIEAAIACGLAGICFTDHMDYDFPPDAIEYPGVKNPFVFNETEYKKNIIDYKNKYSKIWIGTGVECGLQPSESVCQKNRALISQSGWDFIIGSVHLVEQTDPYYPVFWEGKDASCSIRQYFETIWESIRLFSDFDTLGHMDYIVRYAPVGFAYDPYEYQDITDEILKFLIRKDISLEINSSGLFSTASCENPHPVLVKRYLELGGELITIGSDAHMPERIAGGFSVLKQHLKEAGLHQYVTYDQRKPVFHEL